MMNLNGLSAIAPCVGLYFIKHHNREAHRASMLLAFAFSSLFLVSYIVNHALHDDTIFPSRARCARGTRCGVLG
jgi:putative membrane protein